MRDERKRRENRVDRGKRREQSGYRRDERKDRECIEVGWESKGIEQRG